MKKISVIFLAALIIFAACESKRGFDSNSSFISNQIDPDVQYIRVGSGFGPRHPSYIIISSINELNQHTNNLSSNSFWETEYSNIISKYSDSYFADNFIVIVTLEEPSGSNRHKVERINSNGDIIIKQLIPEIGTADMATWNIIIELNNSFIRDQFQVVLE